MWASLSAALIASPSYAVPITTLTFVASGITMSAVKNSQVRAIMDLTLVSAAERKNFLFQNSAWLLIMISAFGVVFALAYTTLPFPVRAGLGNVAVLVGVVSSIMYGKTSNDHVKRVTQKPPTSEAM